MKIADHLSHTSQTLSSLRSADALAYQNHLLLGHLVEKKGVAG